jgi:hypothetical protein
MKKSKSTLAEFEITDGSTVEIRLFGKTLTAEQVRSMLIMYDGMTHTIKVKKLEKK